MSTFSLSNKVYRAFLKPFDKVLYPLVDWQKLREERAREPVPFNKIPHVADLCNPEWMTLMKELWIMFYMDAGNFHRKVWEFAQIIYVLKQAGYLHPGNVGLAVGAGREEILYYLAHKIRKMVAVDLYEGSYLGGEDEPDIPDVPEKYAPFPYPKENLDFKRMNALDLRLPDGSFDFVFSASSIEHFGDDRQIGKAIAEMHRVLKPGGACVVSTEIKLNHLAGRVPHTKLFSVAELVSLFDVRGFRLLEEGMDVRIEDHFLHNWVKLPQEVYKSPHVILRFLNSVFTTLVLAFKKDGEQVTKGAWRSDVTFAPFVYDGEIRVDLRRAAVSVHDRLEATITLANRGNFTWFRNGWSHRIAIGVRLLDESGRLIDPAFGEIVIPKDVAVGEAFTFQTELPLPLPPGNFQLFFDLKRELVTWFHEKGFRPAVVPIRVEGKKDRISS